MSQKLHTSDLIAKVQTDNQLTAKEAKRNVDAVLAAIQDITTPHTTLTLRGFGTFENKVREARIARNPQTGAAIQVPAKATLRFRASKV